MPCSAYIVKRLRRTLCRGHQSFHPLRLSSWAVQELFFSGSWYHRLKLSWHCPQGLLPAPSDLYHYSGWISNEGCLLCFLPNRSAAFFLQLLFCRGILYIPILLTSNRNHWSLETVRFRLRCLPAGPHNWSVRNPWSTMCVHVAPPNFCRAVFLRGWNWRRPCCGEGPVCGQPHVKKQNGWVVPSANRLTAVILPLDR